MARYECSACEESFEADEARCPHCLKKSTVAPEGEAKRAQPAQASPARRSLFSGPGLLVTIAILVPFMMLRHWSIIVTFLVAMVAFGLGRYVNHLLWKWRDK